MCIFAYGQTGSGKTHTMLGAPGDEGITPRAISQIFETSRALGRQGWAFTMQVRGRLALALVSGRCCVFLTRGARARGVLFTAGRHQHTRKHTTKQKKASMLEIYNEEYKDLLSKKKDGAATKAHKVAHDASGHTTVSDLTLVDVDSPDAVSSLLARAMERRSVGCTALNEQSSRSHAVFSLRIEGANASSQLKCEEFWLFVVCRVVGGGKLPSPPLPHHHHQHPPTPTPTKNQHKPKTKNKK